MLLERYLTELGDQGKPLVTSKLANLSDLSSEERKLVRKAWPAIAVDRRREIISRLADLTEDNFELDFEEVFRLCLEDGDGQVRVKAIEGLGECEERWLIGPLVGLLRSDREESVRVAAATGLGKFALLAEFEKLRASDAVKVESALFAAINDEGETLEVRRRAIEAISSLSQPQVKEIIARAYRSDNPSLKASALYAMGRNCDPAWLPILLRELGNPHAELRFEAAAACGELGEEGAVPYLRELIHDSDVQVQLSAIAALGQIGGEEAKEILLSFLKVSDERIQEAAQQAVAELAAEEEPLSFEFEWP